MTTDPVTQGSAFQFSQNTIQWIAKASVLWLFIVGTILTGVLVYVIVWVGDGARDEALKVVFAAFAAVLATVLGVVFGQHYAASKLANASPSSLAVLLGAAMAAVQNAAGDTTLAPILPATAASTPIALAPSVPAAIVPAEPAAGIDAGNPTSSTAPAVTASAP